MPELHEEMRSLIKQFGCGIVANGLMNSKLADKLGARYIEYRNAILSAQRWGLGEKILSDAATVSNWAAYVQRLQQSFAANSRLERPLSDYIVECYAYALGYISSAKMASLEGTMAGLTQQITALERRAESAQAEAKNTIVQSRATLGRAKRFSGLGIVAVFVSVFLLACAIYFVKFDNLRIPRDPALKVKKLFAACNVGDAQYVADLLRSGAYVNSRDSLGDSPMHYAVRLGSEALVDSLQKFNPDLSLANQSGKTPFDLAVESDFLPYVEKTLHAKSHDWMLANYSRLLGYAKTERMKAVLNDAYSKIRQIKDAIKSGDIALLDRNLAYRNGADLHYRDESGKTLLHYAAKEGNVGMLKHLLSLGLSVDATDAVGRIPELDANKLANRTFLNHYRLKNKLIFKAVQKNDEALFNELVGYGADVNACDSNGAPLVHYAVRYNFPMFAKLQKAGANIYAKNRSNETALFVAVYKNNLEIAKKLMSMGLSVHDKNANGKTPMTVVKNRTSKYLLDFTYKDSFFVSTVRRHVLDSAKYYLALGANVNYVDPQTSNAAIHYAVENDDVKALKLLVANRANLTLRRLNQEPVEIALQQRKLAALKFLLQKDRGFAKKIFENGKTLVHEAVMMKDAVQWINVLLQHGASIESLDANGKTPLLGAIKKDDALLVNYFIARRASVSRIDSEGNQPIHAAARYASGDVVRALVAAGADPFAKNSAGEEPVDIAKNFGNASAEDELDNYSLLGKAKKGLRSVTNAGSKLWEKVKSLAD